MSRRNIELINLSLVFLLGLLAFSSIAIADGKPVDFWALKATITIGIFFFLAHLAIRLKLPQADHSLLSLAMLLVILGVATIYQLNTKAATSQLLWVATGLTLLVISLAFLSSYQWLSLYKYVFGFLGITLMLLPIFIGKEVGGAKLWLSFGGYSFQPAEFSKIMLAVFFAAYLNDNRQLLSVGTKKIMGIWFPSLRHFGPLLAFWFISLLILVLEKDLGSSLLFFALFLAMIYMATKRGSYLTVGLILFISGVVFSYWLFPHLRTRIQIWLSPIPVDISGVFYQPAQSLFALSAGGFSGVGWGKGMLGNQVPMPAALTDFIFALLSEQLGLAGSLAIVWTYFYFCFRGFSIAQKAGDGFGKLLAGGLSFALAFQAIIIIGGVIKALPLTGITLPFVSQGGSSLIANFLLIAILLSISQEGEKWA